MLVVFSGGGELGSSLEGTSNFWSDESEDIGEFHSFLYFNTLSISLDVFDLDFVPWTYALIYVNAKFNTSCDILYIIYIRNTLMYWLLTEEKVRNW